MHVSPWCVPRCVPHLRLLWLFTGCLRRILLGASFLGLRQLRIPFLGLVDSCKDVSTNAGMSDCLNELEDFRDDESNPMSKYVKDITDDPYDLCECNTEFDKRIPSCVFNMGTQQFNLGEMKFVSCLFNDFCIEWDGLCGSLAGEIDKCINVESTADDCEAISDCLRGEGFPEDLIDGRLDMPNCRWRQMADYDKLQKRVGIFQREVSERREKRYVLLSAEMFSEKSGETKLTTAPTFYLCSALE